MASTIGVSSDPIDGLSSLPDLPRRMVAPCSALSSLLIVLRELSPALPNSASVLPPLVSSFCESVESLHSHTPSSIWQLLTTRNLLQIARNIEVFLRSSNASPNALTSTEIARREDETSLLGFDRIVASSRSTSFRARLECIRSNCLPHFFHATSRSLPSNRPYEYKRELELSATEKLDAALKTAEEVHGQFLKLASEMNAELTTIVRMSKSALGSNRSQPSFATRALLRKRLHSYLHSEDPNIKEDCEEEEEHRLSETENELLEKMQNPEGPLIVWIAGVEGVGKTSLASFIASHSQILRSFPGGVYWVSLGRRPNLIEAQSLLWREITGSKKVFASVEDGTAALMKRFSEALPSLLVLDDVWDELHLQAFLCFEGRGNGRILITSSCSSEDAFGKLEVHRCILHHLDEASGMQMFRLVAMWQGEVDTVRLASVIARGEPWLIQAIASIYYKRSVAHLPPPCEESIENTSGLSLCFDSLQMLHPQLQGCFLDLVAFPKGEWVDSETLIDMWVLGDGIISEEEAHLILSLLAIRGTLEWKLESRLDHDDPSANKAYYDNEQIGYALQVKLLNQFYDFAKVIICRNSSSSNRFYNSGAARAFAPRLSSQEVLDGEREKGLVTKLSVVGSEMAEIPKLGSFPSLRVALLSDSEKLKCIPQAVLAGAAMNLTMLKLSNCSTLMWLPDSIGGLRSLLLLDLSLCVHLSSLPSTIGKLVNLRFLHLSGCISLQILPKSITRLYHLEHFDLSLCSSVKRLPSLLGRLISLRRLNLRGCVSLQALPSSMSALSRLEFLNLSQCSNLSYTPPFLLQASIILQGGGCTTMAVPMDLWKLGRLESLHLCALKKLSYLPGIATKLQHLRHLSMARCRSLEYLPDNLGALSLLESLDLAHTAIRKLPNSIGQLKSLVTLRLRGCSRLLAIPPSISCLLKLELLDAGECWDLTVIPDSLGQSGSLPELRELDVSGSALKDLPCLTKGAMPKLMKLNLSTCRNLRSLPSSFGLLGSLQTLNLEGCQSLASLNSVSVSQLQKLQWLNLRNCTALKTLPVSELEAMKALQFLDVSGCSGLTPFPNSLLECAKKRLFTLVRWGTIWH